MPDNMNASELVAERSRLLARIEQINKALALLGNPTAPVRIETRKNLRNSYLGQVVVYSDESLMVEQDEYDHIGWITAEDAATLTEKGWIDGDLVSLD